MLKNLFKLWDIIKQMGAYAEDILAFFKMVAPYLKDIVDFLKGVFEGYGGVNKVFIELAVKDMKAFTTALKKVGNNPTLARKGFKAMLKAVGAE